MYYLKIRFIIVFTKGVCPIEYASPVIDLDGDCPSGSNLTVDSSCRFGCEDGFELAEDTTFTCLSTGALSTTPVCNRKFTLLLKDTIEY